MSQTSPRQALFLGFLILAIFSFSSIARAQLEIWLAPRADGGAGTGSATDPFGVGTQPKFDHLLLGYYKAGKENITFHLAPGTYHTLGQAGGWACLSNWKFRGAGMDSTIIKLSGYACMEKRPYGQTTIFVQQPWLKTGIEVSDLTVDCSWLDFGSELRGSFTVPSPGHTVSVPVASSTWAKISNYAYIQRKDNYKVVGIYEVTAVTDGTDVVLKNLQGADPCGGRNMQHGTFVAGPVFVGPAVNTCGIAIGARDCRVERVHVTDSGTPIYEAVLGICLTHINGRPRSGDPFYLADGNIIRDCVIDNVWGSYGWCIAVVSNNPDTGNTGTFISAVVEDNVIHSNGMHQGLSSWGTANAIWRDNTVSDCGVGWFVDVGYNKDARIIDNTFLNNRLGIQLGGGYLNGWIRFNVSGNHILVPQHGIGILTNGQVHRSLFANNQILAEEGVDSGVGITTNRDHTDTNTYSNNIISSVLKNSIPSGAGRGFNNTTETGDPISNRGASPMVDRAVKTQR